jgi:hypothetical protein
MSESGELHAEITFTALTTVACCRWWRERSSWQPHVACLWTGSGCGLTTQVSVMSPLLGCMCQHLHMQPFHIWVLQQGRHARGLHHSQHADLNNMCVSPLLTLPPDSPPLPACLQW